MFKIRKFKNEDTKEVIKIITTGLKQLFHCKKKDLGEKLIENLSDIKKNYFDQGGAFFVGEYDQKVVGTVAILPDTNTSARLKRMFLYKKFRGKGYGSKLYDFIEKWCKKQGYKKIILSTYPHFDEAIKLYESKGYKKFKKTKEQFFFYKNI
jgi:putative acetyltransferase